MRTVLLLVAVALAGCSGDGETPQGPACSEAQYEQEGVCVDHVEPHMVLTGLPTTLQQFSATTFTWSLDPGTRGQDEPVHSMDSRIRASMENSAVDNTTGPDGWGIEVQRQQHKNFPDNFTASLSWETSGTLHLKGYMLIDNQNVWQDLATIEITPVVATGNFTTMTVVVDGGAPTLDPAQVTVKVGDGVRFVNENPLYDYTLEFKSAGCPAGGTVSSSGLEVSFLAPASCSFVLKSPASDVAGQGDLSGTVTVARL